MRARAARLQADRRRQKVFLDTPARQTLICLSGAVERARPPRELLNSTDTRASLFALAHFESPRLPFVRLRRRGASVFQMSTRTSPTDRQPAAGESRPATAGRARVLLVEDDSALRRYLGVVLRRAGYEVTEAADGIEALRLALSSPVAAVVTDAVMPRLGGAELCRLLRAQPRFAALPVVMLTGLDAAPHPTDAAAQPDARLTKPVRTDELLSCLARLLGRAG
jgi:CheY-like chemotaxis protein